MIPKQQPKIYHSDLPPAPVVRESIFTYIMETNYHRYNPTELAFVDSAQDSGVTMSRAEVKELALRLGYGLKNHVFLPVDSDRSGGVGGGSEGPGQPQPTSRQQLSRGDTVMFLSANTMSWPTLVYGCLAAGLRMTFGGSSLTPRELSWQWTDSKARVMFVSSELVPVAKDMFRLLKISDEEADERIWIMDRLWDGNLPKYGTATTTATEGNWLSGLLHKGMMEREERFDGEDADETAYICYSSGTTGRPKGVETTHKNVCTVMGMCNQGWKYEDKSRDVQLGLMPFYHIFGLIMHLNYPFMVGEPCILMLQGFDAEELCRNVERFGVTTIMLAPPILLTLSLHPGLDQYNMTTLKYLASGAAPLSPAIAGRVLERLAKQGANVKLIQGCGSTETSCPAQMVLPPDHQKKFGSVGLLLSNLEARLVDENEEDVSEGEAGEMWIRGPTIMKGYLNNPAATAASFAPGGWYKTGDVLRRDGDGYYYIVDRKKELIKYKGYQVAPAELEAVLLENPRVTDVGVIGVEDVYDKNELPRAYIVPADLDILKSPVEKSSFEKAIQRWMQGQVAHYKHLRGGVVAVREIPKSASGKILRKDLREWAKEERKVQPGQLLPARL